MQRSHVRLRGGNSAQILITDVRTLCGGLEAFGLWALGASVPHACMPTVALILVCRAEHKRGGVVDRR